MAQKYSTSIVLWKIFLRIFLFLATIVVAFWTSGIALNLLANYMGYNTPDVFWGGGLDDAFIALGLTLVLWSGIIFGALGKIQDYCFIGFCLVFGLWDYNGTSTVTYGMFWGLIGAALTGNAIGFGFKLLRQRFLPKLKV